MPKRYRMILGATVILAIATVGGIAAAEQGGNSAAHRQDPTTTSGPATDGTSTTTTTTLAPGAKPLGADGQGDVGDASDRIAALCHALREGSEQGQAMKAQHGQAFENLQCDGIAPLGDGNESDDVGDAGDQGQGGSPQSPGQGHGQGLGSDNPNAQGHGKPS